MDPAATPRTLEHVLTDLEELISRERGALTRLDSEALESCVSIKADLDDELKARASELGPLHRGRLQNIAAGLRRNQVLLVHARDQVMGSLALLSGAPASIPGRQKLPSGAVRLSMRG